MNRPMSVRRVPRIAAPSARGTALAVVGVALWAATAAAHEGHDHGDETPAASAPIVAAPRFATASDVFELVGALEGRRIVLWLDRAADTAPVTGATLELDLGQGARVARPLGDAYVVELDAPPAPGRLAIAVTVTAGTEADLLAAELEVPAGTPAASAPASTAVSTAADAIGWIGPIGPATAAIAAAAALVGWALGRRRGAGRAAR